MEAAEYRRRMLELEARKVDALEAVVTHLLRKEKPLVVEKKKKKPLVVEKKNNPLVEEFLAYMYETTGEWTDYVPRSEMFEVFSAWMEHETDENGNGREHSPIEDSQTLFGTEISRILGPAKTIRNSEGKLLRGNRGVRMKEDRLAKWRPTEN